ncbi:S16 family serine protease [Acidithiobacillus ferriphilus]|uniref:S16 family serine protease n=1 Tax=Acidithiobacillus ferriphilus TaxID=1689834 RepID=UPI0027E10FB1|nr:S16 family serine protease [Acidithiobacillus ferriphilus]
MEIIALSGYTEEDKMHIAFRYLLPRQREAAGLTAEQLVLEEDTLLALIRGYTREASCRNLERELGAICRWVAVRVAEGSSSGMQVRPDDLATVLGPQHFENEVASRVALPGVATGLAWTPVGGDILFIEASKSPGNGRLILTGQLGDVMKESAQAAMSLVKARAADWQIAQESIDKSDIHIHIPAGAIPKDGPSAGVTLTVAQPPGLRRDPRECPATTHFHLDRAGGRGSGTGAGFQSGCIELVGVARRRFHIIPFGTIVSGYHPSSDSHAQRMMMFAMRLHQLSFRRRSPYRCSIPCLRQRRASGMVS